MQNIEIVPIRLPGQNPVVVHLPPGSGSRIIPNLTQRAWLPYRVILCEDEGKTRWEVSGHRSLRSAEQVCRRQNREAHPEFFYVVVVLKEES